MVGKVGINPNEFGLLTPRETSLIHNAWIEHQTFSERQQWERVRWQTTYLLNIQLKEKDRQTPNKFFPFEWDNETTIEIKPSTRKRFEELAKKWG